MKGVPQARNNSSIVRRQTWFTGRDLVFKYFIFNIKFNYSPCKHKLPPTNTAKFKHLKSNGNKLTVKSLLMTFCVQIPAPIYKFKNAYRGFDWHGKSVNLLSCN